MDFTRLRTAISRAAQALVEQDPVKVLDSEFESVDPVSLRCRWSRYSRPKSSGVELAFVERLNRSFRCTLGHLEPPLGGVQ